MRTESDAKDAEAQGTWKDTRRDQAQSLFAAFIHTYFSWIKVHLNKRDLKIAFRVAVAAWVGLLLLLIDSSRQLMGSAGWLAILSNLPASCSILSPHRCW